MDTAAPTVRSLAVGTGNPNCRLCELWQTCKTVCIPSVSYRFGGSGQKPQATALLVVGEAPGASEDEAGEPFVGKSGQILRVGYLDRLRLGDHADIYLSNAVRCRPPGNETPSKKMVRACSAYLMDDILQLQQHYEKVVILAVGSVAATSVGSKTLTAALAKQGYDFLGCHVFSTYHPAYLLRNPSMSASVDAHLHLLRDYLAGKDITPHAAPEEIDLAPPPPDYPIGCLSIDIETYGIIRGATQTQFHPRKSLRWDKVPYSEQVVTVGLSWRDPEGQLRHALFVTPDRQHRRALATFLRSVLRHPDFGYLLGQNILFDLLYLRAYSPVLRRLLDHPVRVLDLLVVNYLHNELRPERSLKSLAPLLQVTKYDDGFKQYRNPFDPDLHKYNCQDTMATLLCAERLEALITERYGEQSRKLTEFSRSWYSDLLWLAVWMSEAGVALDVPYLERLDATLQGSLDRLKRIAEQRGLILRGEGSEKSKRGAMDLAFEEVTNLLPPFKQPQLELTKKTGKVSFSVENRNTLLNHLPLKSPAGIGLRIMGRYQDVSGLLDRYLTPILRGRGKSHWDQSTRAIDNIVYPRWFIVPSEFDDGSRGGTKQGRIVCLRGDTLIYTPDGPKRLESVVGRGVDEVLTVQDDWSLRFVRPSRYLRGGTQPVYRVTLSSAGNYHRRSGTESAVHATPEHRFIRLDGSFVEVRNLKVGDRLRHVQKYTDHHGYPRLRMSWGGGRRVEQFLHRLSTGAPEGLEVHHLDGNRCNWVRNNLEVVTPGDHRRIHWGEGGITITCAHCGKDVRTRRTRSRRRFCSIPCYHSWQKVVNYRVESIDFVGHEEVYCLEVPGTENFVLWNGLVSGNCKAPPIQTFPPSIKRAITCRFPRGHLIWFDYSQIELRVAALLSGDEVMSREYVGKPDLHGKTAELIFGADIRNHPEFKSKYRQAGKVLNFLMLYRGGAKKFQESLLRDLGIDYPLDKCESAIRQFWARHKGLALYQAGLLDFVKKHGYYELPLTGQSRLFLGGKQAQEAQVNEVVNLPVQTIAANIMLSAQFELFRRMREQVYPHPVVPLNVYDASPIEVPYGQVPRTLELMAEVLPNPPYYEALCNELGRRLPMVVEYKVDGGSPLELGHVAQCPQAVAA